MLEKLLRCFKFAPTYSELEDENKELQEKLDAVSFKAAIASLYASALEDELEEVEEDLDKAETLIEAIEDAIIKYYE